MKLKLSVIALLAMIMPVEARAATLTDAEAMFLDQLVTAATVLERRCTGYEVNGAGGVQAGANLLGSADAAMAMIGAFDLPSSPMTAMPTTHINSVPRCPRQPARRPIESGRV